MNLVTLFRDGCRSLSRSPGFVASATATLALGIGLATAVYAVADALLLRPLPIVDQARVVTLWAEKRDGSQSHWPLSLQEEREFADRAGPFSKVAYTDFYGAIAAPVLIGDHTATLRRALVSGNYFSMLGARATLGRALVDSDDQLGAAPVVVLSDAAWRRHFGGDTSVVGRRLTGQLDGITHTIIGVMPAGLEYPAGADFWGPYTPTRLRSAADSNLAALDLIARLGPGTAIVQARSALDDYLARPDAPPFSRQLRGVVAPVARVILGDTRSAVIAFAAAAALLLLITGINVANLLLVRGLGRAREMAVRSALGGARRQIVAQLLVENALLAALGGLAGLGVAAVALRGFLAMAPSQLPLTDTIQLDWRAAAAAFAIAGASLLLFGLVPAVTGGRASGAQVLRSGGRQGPSRGNRLVGEGLVAAQVGLTVLVLTAAALVGRSFLNLQGAPLAFDGSRLLMVELGLRQDRYDSPEKQLGLLRQVLAHIKRTPGVEAATPVVAVPFSGTSGWTGRAGTVDQSPEEASRNPAFNVELVTSDYFASFGLPVVRGRGLMESDQPGSERVVVISEATANAYFPGRDPIGGQLRMGAGAPLTVVGVVPDTRYRDLRQAMPSVYFPLAQSFFPFTPNVIAVRTRGRPETLVRAITRAVEEAAPGVVVSRAAGFDAHMRAPLAEPRLNTFLLSLFGLGAVTLAAVGLFAVMGTLVRQRGLELGVRMALGATSKTVLLGLLARGLRIAGIGVAAGIGLALVGNRLLGSLLYGVGPTDLPTLLGVALFVLAVMLISTYLPARQGSRVDPASALRAHA